MDKREFDAIWKGPVNRIGVSTLLLAVVLSFIPILYLYFVHGVIPDLNTALKAWGMIASSCYGS